jgi:anthranilate phosphoribosyltransferase
MEGKKKNIPLLILAANYLKETHFVITAAPSMQDKPALSMLDLTNTLPDNIHLVSRENYLPKLEALHQLRDNLKLRTVFNTLEKLHHPLQSKFAVIGAHHGPYFKKYAEVFAHQYHRMAIVQGDEGCGEIIKKSKIHIIEKGKLVEEFFIDPKDFSIDFEKPMEKVSLNEALQQILNPSEALQKLARLNASIYCYTINPSSSIKEYFSNL